MNISGEKIISKCTHWGPIYTQSAGGPVQVLEFFFKKEGLEKEIHIFEKKKEIHIKKKKIHILSFLC